MKLTLDKMSRVLVPKPLRERFGLQPGDQLNVRVEADGIRLCPVHPVAAVVMEGGLLVCSSEVPAAVWDLPAFIAQQRDQRSRELGGI